MALERIVRPNQFAVKKGPDRVTRSITAQNDIVMVIGKGQVKKTKLTGSESLSASWYAIKHPTENRR